MNDVFCRRAAIETAWSRSLGLGMPASLSHSDSQVHVSSHLMP